MRGCSLRHWVPGYPLQQALSAVVEGLDPPACAEMPGHRPVASLAQGSGRGGGAQAESFTPLAEQLRASAQEQSEGPAQRARSVHYGPPAVPRGVRRNPLIDCWTATVRLHGAMSTLANPVLREGHHFGGSRSVTHRQPVQPQQSNRAGCSLGVFA